jgi:hypothetical protein
MTALQKTPKDIAKEIRELDENINKAFRFTITTAIKAGKLLNEAKKMLGHGQFIPWLKDNSIPERTARDYMMFAQYSDNIKGVKDMTEARKLIDEQRDKEDALDRIRVAGAIEKREKTGEKPEDWDRHCDYEWDKRQKKKEAIPEIEPEVVKQEEDDFFKAPKTSIADGGYHAEGICIAIDQSLNDLSSDVNQQITMLNNIIKHCRDKSNELQGKA